MAECSRSGGRPRENRAFDARDAVNLDGGGSTGITIGDHLVSRPSDPTGERPIGDALVLTD
ncbi:MAG: phosphodiester glycosidase family protein [Actinomycetota bacterium]